MAMGPQGARPAYVLGVNAALHDPAAALVRDGELIAMVEEERLSRNKGAFGESPRRAVAACLAEAGIGLEDIAEIAIGWDIPALIESENLSPLGEHDVAERLFGERKPPDAMPPVRFVEHHLAHAASAFYTSGWEEAAILVADGRGEYVATTVATGGPAGIEIVETWEASQSLGFLYSEAAQWAGLTKRGVGKLMGLAAYGKACQPVPFGVSGRSYEIPGSPPLESTVSDQLRELGRRLRDDFRKHNFPFSLGDPSDVMAHADFAASIQGTLERILLNLATTIRRESGHTRLVMAGGVAQNCAANGVLIRSGIFDEVWVPPFPYDAGASVGAALLADRDRAPRGKPGPRLPHALWGPAAGELDSDSLAGLEGCETARHDGAELAEVVARDLAEGRLVGWCQGRAEVGQRALGARSILCDPRKRAALVRANVVKGREAWRPLAPAVLNERAGEVFDDPLPAAAGFMLAALPVRGDARRRLPATVHVDGSARPQAVRPGQGRYHEVIAAFHERTGVPAVVNTSFNLAGEPIVLSSADAVSTFMRSELDVLVVDDLVARKRA